jgi:shikimate dehydrogenase
LSIDNGRLIGYNTDAIGAIRALEEKIDLPLETRLLTIAKERGCLTINGLGMFVHQGAEQFRLWTGLEPPINTMTRVATQALRQNL